MAPQTVLEPTGIPSISLEFNFIVTYQTILSFPSESVVNLLQVYLVAPRLYLECFTH